MTAENEPLSPAQRLLILDGELDELRSMADIAVQMMEAYTSEKLALVKDNEPTAYSVTTAAFKHLEEHERRLIFAVYHVHNMAADLRRRYSV